MRSVEQARYPNSFYAADDLAGGRVESAPEKERLLPERYRVYAFGGKSVTGKSTAAREFAKRHNLDLLEGGKTLRGKSGISDKEVGFDPRTRDTQIDIDFDEYAIQMMIRYLTTPTLPPLAVEAHLSAWHAEEAITRIQTEEQYKDFRYIDSSYIVKIILTASDTTLGERGRIRKPEYTIEEAVQEARTRNENDIIRWNILHPGLGNPYSRARFDIKIKTDRKTPTSYVSKTVEEELNEIERKVIILHGKKELQEAEGKIKPFNPKKEETTIYDNPPHQTAS